MFILLVEAGDASLRIAQVEKTRGRVTIVKDGIFELPHPLRDGGFLENTPWLARLLRSSIEAGGFAPDAKIILTFGDSLVRFKTFMHPPAKPAVIKSFAVIEAETVLRGEIDDYVIETLTYNTKPDIDGQVKSILYAIDRVSLFRVVDSLTAAGFDVIKVLPRIASFVEATLGVLQGAPELATKTFAAIDFTDGRAQLAIFDKGEPLFESSYASVALSMSELLGSDSGEAESSIDSGPDDLQIAGVPADGPGGSDVDRFDEVTLYPGDYPAFPIAGSQPAVVTENDALELLPELASNDVGHRVVQPFVTEEPLILIDENVSIAAGEGAGPTVDTAISPEQPLDAEIQLPRLIDEPDSGAVAESQAPAASLSGTPRFSASSDTFSSVVDEGDPAVVAARYVPGSPLSQEALREIESAVDPAVSEAMRGLRIVIAAERLDLDSVIISGGLAALPGVRERIEQLAGVPCRFIDDYYASMSSVVRVAPELAGDPTVFSEMISLVGGAFGKYAGELDLLAERNASNSGNAMQTAIIAAVSAAMVLAMAILPINYYLAQVQVKNDEEVLKSVAYASIEELRQKVVEYEELTKPVEDTSTPLPVRQSRTWIWHEDLYNSLPWSFLRYSMSYDPNTGLIPLQFTVTSSNEYLRFKKRMDTSSFFDIAAPLTYTRSIENSQTVVNGTVTLRYRHVSPLMLELLEPVAEPAAVEGEGEDL